MGLLEFSISKLEIFIMVFFRVMALLMIMPIFDNQKIIPQFKILISILVSYVLFPIVDAQNFVMPATMGAIVWIILKEIFLGLVIGFTAKLVFVAVELGSNFAGVQMGFGASSVVDPISNSSTLVIATFQVWVATMLFLSLNGHHLFFSAIAETFYKIPIGTASMTGGLAKTIVDYTATVFLVSIKLAAPITAVMIMTNAVLGIISRFVPQMNVFVMSFPLSIGIGLIILSASIPFIAYMIKSLFELMSFDIAKVISLL